MSYSTSTAGAATGLAVLEERLRDDFVTLGWPAKAWIPPSTRKGLPVHDVLVIGAGQAGLALNMALQQVGIKPVLLDKSAPDFEGPWATTARMETLRSPKELTGPAMGVAALSFRAWFIAQFGLDAWTALDKIPRLQWMDYLRWYRRVTNADVRNGHEVIAVRPQADGVVEVDVRANGVTATWQTRRLVLATGRDGLGGATVPAFMRGVDRKFWAHSSDAMDYATLAGKHVGVVGAGASAMDSAATALENGAASVDMLIRRQQLPLINKSKGSGVPGLTHGQYLLPDAWKWRIRHYINAQQVPPPHGSTLRVSRHDNAFFNLGCAVQSVEKAGNKLQVQTSAGVFVLDFLIVSTGFAIDWSLRPEFADIAAHVKLWNSRFTPETGDEDAELSASPDLGPLFEFQGDLPGLDRIHCFCYPAALSHGTVSGDIPAISDGARKLAQGLASLFYLDDIEQHFDKLKAYAEPELDGTEWTAADSAARIRQLQP
ncbi:MULTISPECIES: NAD(P)-binding domain-containing protein [Comamonas]|uniref:NAD(P)-binding domain-containing protein n=1 Tax=Comamonas TaxID=283 RepID=UPI00051046DF|nr:MULTISPECIES: NAD(P)/FAD-dependent oxidoreductase [Comamonas]KGH01149.1 FAD-dependent oxidoreductase [Comamonas thiooxydans]TZG10040.1 NAD(P)/FAD-dependent oxidoreductase [Comamonas thiooxydans]UNV91147.1 NAD(P)/FAD-dependent oxidoreductase [Comamonas sp. 7D-2evo1]UNV96054.1 NAD(P)/FAD-dependent oxidoreductase [Comamonas sp. 7D-2]UNW00786.1 NAD(P)/FAD-dependent oxidoreductase [Comamonas sp. 7D-2evo2]